MEKKVQDVVSMDRGFLNYLIRQIKAQTMLVTESPLRPIEEAQKDNEWGYAKDPGDVHRKDGNQFRLGHVDVKTGSREVFEWTQPYVEEKKDPKTGLSSKVSLLVVKVDGEEYLLIRMKEEPLIPNAPGHGSLNSAFSVSIASLASYGAKVPGICLQEKEQTLAMVINQDGARFKEKMVEFSIVYREVDPERFKAIEIDAASYWVKVEWLLDAANAGFYVSSNLMQVVGLLPMLKR